MDILGGNIHFRCQYILGAHMSISGPNMSILGANMYISGANIYISGANMYKSVPFEKVQPQ